MATYIQGQTDQIPMIQPWTPDFNMMQKALSTMQNRYDTGFAAVNNVYNSVVNADLSNFDNQSARDNYVKQATSKLKNITSMDLSEDKNVREAESAFAPFWEDDEIIYDQAMTKEYRSQISSVEEAKTSSDDKIRAGYNPIVERDINNGLQQLVNAKRGDGTIFKVEKRKFVPWTDMNKYLNDALKDQGGVKSWDEANNGYIETLTGGTRIKVGMAEWAKSQMTPQMEEQFRIEARVAHEDGIKELKRMNPNLDDKQITQELAKSVLKEHIDNSQRQVDYYTSQKSDIETRLENIRQWTEKNRPDKTMLPSHQEMYFNLQNRLHDIDNGLKSSNQTLTAYSKPGSKEYEAAYENVVSSPRNFFYSTIKDRRINNYATGIASLEGRKLTKDDTYMTIYTQKEENYRKSLDIQQKNDALATKDLNGDGVIDDKDKPATSGNDKDNEEDPGHYLGASIDKVEQRDAVNVFRNAKLRAHVNSTELSFQGMEEYLSLSGGIAQVADYTESKEFIKAAKAWQANPFDKAAKSKVVDSKIFGYLRSEGFISKQGGVAGPVSTMLGLEQFVSRGLETSLKDKTLNQNEIYRIGKYFQDSHSEQAEFERMDRLEQAMTKSVLTGRNKDKFTKLVDDKNNLLSEEDFVKKHYNQSLNLISDQGYTVNMTTPEFIKLKNSGQITNVTTDTKAFQGGASRTISFTKDGQEMSFHESLSAAFPAEKYKALYEVASGKYSKEYNDLNTSLSNEATPQMREFQNQTGRIGHTIEFRNLKTDKVEQADDLASEILQPANNTGYAVNFDPDDEDVNTFKEYVRTHPEVVSTVNYNTLTKSGRQSLQLNFKKDMFMKDGVKLVGLKIDTDKLNQIVAKGLELEMSDVASGKAINKLPKPHEYLMYGNLLRDEVIKAPPIMKSMGFDYTLETDSSGKVARLHIKRYVPSSTKPGEYDWVSDTPYRFDLYGEYKKLPEQIMGYIGQAFQKNAEENQNVIKGWGTATGPKSMTIEEANQQVQQSRVGR